VLEEKGLKTLLYNCSYRIKQRQLLNCYFVVIHVMKITDDVERWVLISYSLGQRTKDVQNKE